ncbi:hypothetical protein, partial [Kribbella sp.]|uniref:hypothetical protein n=1 Tax=Kribbella sp. TaxID=1871183 RepID=UPI002D502A75
MRNGGSGRLARITRRALVALGLGTCAALGIAPTAHAAPKVADGNENNLLPAVHLSTRPGPAGLQVPRIPGLTDRDTQLPAVRASSPRSASSTPSPSTPASSHHSTPDGPAAVTLTNTPPHLGSAPTNHGPHPTNPNT